MIAGTLGRRGTTPKNRDLLALYRSLGGWKTIAMVMRYAHVNVGELAHTIDNLPWAKLGEI